MYGCETISFGQGFGTPCAFCYAKGEQSMKLGMAVWNGRISPLFDASRRLEVLDIEKEQIVSQKEYEIETDDFSAKAAWLAERGIEILICGAVSRSLAKMIIACGIRLVSFVAGDSKEVLAAFLAGDLPSPHLCSPSAKVSVDNIKD